MDVDETSPDPESFVSSSLSSTPNAAEQPDTSDVATVTKPRKSEPAPVAIPLEQYIPLGCVIVTLGLRTDPTEIKSAEWTEATEFLPELLDSTIPWKSIVALWRARWIRVLRIWLCESADQEIWRLYVLPDDIANAAVDRNRPNLRKCLGDVLGVVDISPSLWSGRKDPIEFRRFDRWASAELCSLFYMFNTLPSPEPNLTRVRGRHNRVTMKRLMDADLRLRGLLTPLYPYQRRTAATMFQREAAPLLSLDPRLESRKSPIGNQYWFEARSTSLLQEPRYYDTPRGGILAETMGLGKTLICLSLILATRGHLPGVPPHCQKAEMPVREDGVASLMQMATSAIVRNSIPWRQYFDDICESRGEEMAECKSFLEHEIPYYEIPARVIRSNRSSSITSPPELVQMCSGTLIVVPKNLMHQWRTEIIKHVEEGALKILFMENPRTMVPAAEDLARFDVVIFTRPRFDRELKTEDFYYESPLKKLHWLRLIVDEGHNFSSSTSNSAILAEKCIRAERRWVVSGTPAKDLLGIETDLEAMTQEIGGQDLSRYRSRTLELRSGFNYQVEQSSGAIKSLGSLAAHFLKAQPWAVSLEDEFAPPVKWEDYIYRHESVNGRTHSGFSHCLRQTLKNLVIKTQPEDVERDITLPPLTHKVVRLEPCFFDKLTANLFVLLFTTNAVTSERTDVDYLFHANSRAHLHRLVANLRLSSFYWTGFDAESVAKTIGIGQKYLAKENIGCSAEDQQMLLDAMEAASSALNSFAWNAVSQSQEMGMIIQNWPDESASAWALDGRQSPLMVGISSTLIAQKHINNALTSDNPTVGLQEAGIAAREATMRQQMDDGPLKKKQPASSEMVKLGIPAAGVNDEKMGAKRLTALGASVATSPKKNSPTRSSQVTSSDAVGDQQNGQEASSLSAKRNKRRLTEADTTVDLDSGTLLGSTSLVGTTSAKFSYVLDRVLQLQLTEKILIFYDGNHIAYWLSQALDLFHSATDIHHTNACRQIHALVIS